MMHNPAMNRTVQQRRYACRYASSYASRVWSCTATIRGGQLRLFWIYARHLCVVNNAKVVPGESKKDYRLTGSVA